MKHLLFAYDGSPGADAALEDLALAGLGDDIACEVLTVHDAWLPADPEAGSPPPVGDTVPFVRASRDQVRAQVEACRAVAGRGAARLRALFPRWQVGVVANADSPAWALVQRADAWPADLVVVGAHSHSILERFFLGSVSQRVLAEARCSVRIGRARAGRTGPPRILVAVDGSEDALAAVKSLAARTWPAGTRFAAATVFESRLVAVAWPAVYAEQWAAKGAHDLRGWAGEMAEAAVRLLRERGHPVELHLLEGDPKKLLLRQAEALGADCVVLGARGMQHGSRYRLGTLAAAVAERAPCSVEIIRPRPA